MPTSATHLHILDPFEEVARRIELAFRNVPDRNGHHAQAATRQPVIFGQQPRRGIHPATSGSRQAVSHVDDRERTTSGAPLTLHRTISFPEPSVTL